MVNWSKRLVPTIAATSLFLSCGAIANGVSQAETAILIPGAMPFKQINPIYRIVAESYPSIGEHFYQGDKQIVGYSQNPLAADRALRDGVTQAALAVQQTDGKVVVIGESMGAMVAWRLAAELADTPGAPSKDDLSFVVIAPPDAGVAEYFKEGTFIPILNYRITRIADSPYDTTIVIGEYDGWADPPDRPWNVVSSANALAGIAYVHGPPSFTADVSDLTPTVDGNVKTYLVPTENLPLTQVFRDVGVPDKLVDRADQVLRPVVDAGYVRHDQPGDTRPYLYDGGIHRNVQSQQQVREPLRARVGTGPDVGQQPREHRTQLRQTIRAAGKDLRDRVEAGFGQLKKRIADRLAEREKPRE
jgi:pimeloyl-ACP methyl ester carboxylesterase